MRANVQAVDRIGKAFAREQEAGRWPVWGPELVIVAPAVFRCVCCGGNRRTEERREPQSEVCVRCVRAAGFGI